MKMRLTLCWTLSWALAGLVGASRLAAAPALTKVAENNWLTLYVDDPKAVAHDMLLEIQDRLSALTPQLRSLMGAGAQSSRKYTVEVYADAKAYARLGPAGSAGRYVPQSNRTLVRADKQAAHLTLVTAQHETSHLLTDQVLNRRNVPLWLDEGLAEYAEMGVWTGDHLVLGVIPCKRGGYFWSSPKALYNRLAVVQGALRSDKFVPWSKLFEWRDGNEAQMAKTGLLWFDQAWPIVQFFLQAENGKYAAQFQRALAGVSRGGWDSSFRSQFGRDILAFEQEWKKWWQALPDEPTDELYLQATAAKAAGILGRQLMLGFRPKTITDLLANTADKSFRAKLAANLALRLPNSFLDRTIDEIKSTKGISLKPGANDVPMVLIARQDKPDIVGLVAPAAGGGIQVAVRMTQQ